MKFSKILAFVLSLIMSLTLIGCVPTPPDGDDNGGSSNRVPEGTIVLTSFENRVKELQQIRVLDGIGDIDITNNKAYVKSGDYALAVRPLGKYYSSTGAMFHYSLKSEMIGYDYRDLSYLRQVSAEVYNAESHDVSMKFGLVMELVTTDIWNKTNLVKFDLKPGWNTVTYNIDVSVINILYDPLDAQGIYFGFDRVGSRDIEDAPEIYMDDIKLHYGKTKVEAVDLLEFSEATTDDGVGNKDWYEICDFDKLYQNYIIYSEPENPGCEAEFVAENINLKYGITATTGNNALRVSMKPTTDGTSWNKIAIPQGIMQACNLKNIPEGLWENYYFCFDIQVRARGTGYNDKNIVLYPEFFDGGYGSCANYWACEASVGKWTTYRIGLADLVGRKSGGKSKVQNPGYFRLAWNDADVSQDGLDVLIDSIRLVRM